MEKRGEGKGIVTVHESVGATPPSQEVETQMHSIQDANLIYLVNCCLSVCLSVCHVLCCFALLFCCF